MGAMDRDSLQTFMTIHETGSFSAAGEALGRSQPAISRRIALLEDHLRAPLFERGGARVILSDAGRTLLPYAQQALAALSAAESAVAGARGEAAGPVSVAAVGTLAGANLTPILKRFTAENPKADLSLRTATSAEVSDLVRRGEATVGLRYLLDSAPDLVCEHIGSENMVVACAPEHPLAGRSVDSIAALAGEAWFAFPNAFDHRETFADNIFAQFQAVGIGEVRASPVDSLTAQKRLVEAGLGLALFSQSAAREERRAGALAVIDVSDLTATNPIYLVTRKDGYLSPAAERLMAGLREGKVAG